MNNLSHYYHNQAIRYCAVGGLNTIVTAAVILFLTGSGVGLYVSNLCGYIIGILFSFFLNIHFTFSSKPSFHRLIKFIVCCVACYGINLVVMNFVMLLNSDKYIIQISGMIFYTIFGFIINKFWVMK